MPVHRWSAVALLIAGVSIARVPAAATGQIPASNLAAPAPNALSPELATLTSKLSLAPSELSAIADHGSLPAGWAQALEDAYKSGLDAATSAGVDAARAPFIGGQFAAYLTRIERDARTRGSATFDSVVVSVRRDVCETLRMNFGEAMAAAADARLAGLPPLQVH